MTYNVRPRIAPEKIFAKLVVRFGRRHPIIIGTCLFLLVGTDKGQIFGARHVVERAAVQITAGQFFLIELQQIAGLHGDFGLAVPFHASEPSHQ